MNFTLLSLFIPTFIVVSATPGLCMTLSMTLGMTIGIRRTLWMMAGELVGVGLIAVAAVLGIASIMLKHPEVFVVLKYVGGAYLFWLGVQLWRSCGRMAIQDVEEKEQKRATRKELISQGFVTAIANPKGWAFIVSLLPPFIDASLPLTPQLSMLVVVILCIEFVFLLIYAQGGKTMRRFLQKSGNVQRINKSAGVLMMVVGGWLAFG